MVTSYIFSNNTLTPTDGPDGSIVVFTNPDAKERQQLCSSFAVDEHTLMSALDPDEVPRMEIDDGAIHLIWKRPLNYSAQDNFFFNVASVGLFLANDRLALVLTEDVPIAATGVRKLQRLDSLFNVVLVFLYETIHHYMEHLKVIKMISRDLQQKINTSMENKHLIQMFNLSESLIYYANAISGNGAVLTRLRAHAEKANFGSEALDLLDDVIIENTQCFKQAEIYSTVFSGLMDARTSLVNNNMNVLLKNLTIINVVFLPLNLIAGIGGMSEFSMMTSHIDWRIAYSMFLAAMIVIGWFTALVLGRMDFVGNRIMWKKKAQKGRK
jgi:magnesium transporter